MENFNSQLDIFRTQKRSERHINLGAIWIITRVECIRPSSRQIKKKTLQEEKPEDYHDVIDD